MIFAKVLPQMKFFQIDSFIIQLIRIYSCKCFIYLRLLTVHFKNSTFPLFFLAFSSKEKSCGDNFLKQIEGKYFNNSIYDEMIIIKWFIGYSKFARYPMNLYFIHCCHFIIGFYYYYLSMVNLYWICHLQI